MTGALCPTGCGRQIKPGHLMCLHCWREVPKDLQREVNRTWRRCQRTLEAFPEYAQAREAAIASVA